eukprot:1242304-Prymnesium_polylepis.1
MPTPTPQPRPQVGALALLREGRAVQMQTRDEQWAWARREDPAFGVRVLTVEVRPRDAGAAAGSAELHGAEEEEAVEVARLAAGAGGGVGGAGGALSLIHI